jgi:hypothetical protein
VVSLCIGLWRHAQWTWWILTIVTYTLGVLGVLVAFNEPDWPYRLRNGFRALLSLAIVVWYFQFKPSVVTYYAAINALRRNPEGTSRGDAA